MKKTFLVAILLAGGGGLVGAGLASASPALLSLREDPAFAEIQTGRFRLAEDAGPARGDDLWLAVDGNGLAQVGSVAPASRVAVRADASGASAGMAREFSTWSDLTAVFRPSRWRLPIRVGEPLSFLNYRAWKEAPGRTAKILVGVVVVAGITYAVVEGASGGGGGDDPAEPPDAETPVPVPATRPTSSGCWSRAASPWSSCGSTSPRRSSASGWRRGDPIR